MDLLTKARELFTGEDEPASSEALRETMRELREAVEERKTRLEELNREHGKMLLHGTDEAVAEHEALIRELEREIERLELARDQTLDEMRAAQTRERAAEQAERASRLPRLAAKLEEADRVRRESATELQETLTAFHQARAKLAREGIEPIYLEDDAVDHLERVAELLPGSFTGFDRLRAPEDASPKRRIVLRSLPGEPGFERSLEGEWTEEERAAVEGWPGITTGGKRRVVHAGAQPKIETEH